MMLFRIFLLILTSQSLIAQVCSPETFCRSQNHPQTVVDFDRKAWNTIENVSQGYMHNFELKLPDNCACAKIESVDIELEDWSVITNDIEAILGPGCYGGLYYNIGPCEDFDPISCDPGSYYDEGFFNFPSISYDENDIDLSPGSTLSVDIIILTNDFCTTDRDVITQGIFEADYTLCVTINYEEGIPDPTLENIDDLEICIPTIDLDAQNGFEEYIWEQLAGGDLESNDQELEDATAGTYSLSVIDSEGCLQIEEFDVIYSPPFEIVVPDTVRLCNSNSDSIFINTLPQVDTSDLNICWQNTLGTVLSQNAFFLPTSNGTYTLKAIDEDDCVVTKTFEVVLANVSPAQISEAQTDVFLCENGSLDVSALIPSTDTNNYIFEWANGLDTIKNQTLNISSTGEYILIQSNAIGCTESRDTINVIIANPSLQACDDNNNCTTNDMESVLPDGTVCVPCMGQLEDCASGPTTTRPRNDMNPSTINDMETVLDCDGSVCVPCAGILSDCNNTTPTEQACDDNDPCTENDTESVLPDGTICEPCTGNIIDCSNIIPGTFTTQPCDDNDPSTINDMETILNCDGTVCTPCTGIPADCSSGTLIVQACDDMNPCTENDMETVIADGTICEPCAGTIIDCSTGPTTIRPCDDNNPSTIDDMETVLDCDGSICVPCEGIASDCNNTTPIVQICNDMDDCTDNDTESVLPDGTVCEPCAGTAIDCTNGTTTTQPCDDMNPSTIDDMETILDCDGTVCIPCAGTASDCNNTTPIVQPCDDNNVCTEDDMEAVLPDGTVCEPCAGTVIDCTTGPTSTVACDDMDDNTIDDLEVILDCDGSICVPCAGIPVDCSTGNPIQQACDDMNPCTENDMEEVLADGTICEPCAGEVIDCSNGPTTTQPCDDMNDDTVDDVETILDCDGSVCVPCEGIQSDCMNATPIQQPCDDMNPCTENDMEEVLADGTICEPCAGEVTDCSNGSTTTLPCDDMDEDTVDDVETILDCDGSVCVPCAGVSSECQSTTLIEQACDDGIACTINDQEVVLPDGTICEPCLGEFLDCETEGQTQIIPCDDNDDATINDVETILLCDGSICISCRGTTTTETIYFINIIQPNTNEGSFKLYATNPISINFLSVFDRWGNEVHAAKNVLSDDSSASWSGRNMDGNEMEQGVYVYFVEYVLNGATIQKSGHITLIR